MVNKKKIDKVKKPPTVKEIQEVVEMLVKAMEKGWRFIVVHDFEEQKGIKEDKVFEVIELLKKIKLFNYDTMQFDDPWTVDVFDRNAEHVNPRGVITFLPIPKEDLTVDSFTKKVKNFYEKYDFVKLKMICESKEKASSILLKAGYIGPVPIYDFENKILKYLDTKTPIAVGNEAFICEKLFSVGIGDEVPIDEISVEDEHVFTSKDVLKKRQNAMHSINRKFKERTGIPNLFRVKNSNMRVTILENNQ